MKNSRGQCSLVFLRVSIKDERLHVLTTLWARCYIGLMIKKRKHHIIPVTYLSGFTDQAGKLYQYRKDSPSNPQYNVPRELGHRRDYYSQPTPEGETDHNKLEDFFSTIEAKWSTVVAKIVSREQLSQNDRMALYEFLYLTKSRIPATRDAIEKMLAFQVKETGKFLEETGQLPPRPPELEGVELQVSIDPHKSIHAMKDIAEGFSRIFDFTRLVIYHNKTNTHLLTSDNPIVCFDASVCEKEIQPYSSGNLLDIEFIFPITSNLVLHGHPSYSDQDHFSYKTIDSANVIRRYNRLICKFAYERIFSAVKGHEPLILKHASKSPVLNITSQQIGDGTLVTWNHEFGPRTKLPKWDERRAPSANET